MMRRSGDVHDVSAFLIAKITLYRVPFITERVLPFAVLVGAMFCYLNLSRRLELVVARSAGISAWQFTAPAIAIALLIGAGATAFTTRSRPCCASSPPRWRAAWLARTAAFATSTAGAGS